MSGRVQTAGEYLVKLLESYGVDYIFGIPGVHTVEFYRALPETTIRHVTPRHEQGAGFMADGYARVSGKPGVCFIVTGPGMTNIATAMGQAYADSVPMLVISAVNARDQLAMGQGHLHELPSQRNLVAGVTAFSHTLLDANQLPEVIARAFTVFRSQRPRPVHIEIPLDVIVAPAGHLSSEAWPVPEKPAAAASTIMRAAQILNSAERPLIVAGGGAADAAIEVTAIAEKLDAPVFSTINGKGILKPSHPLALAGNLSMRPVLSELADSDAVLAIGTEFGDTEMYPDPVPLKFGGSLIRIDIDPTQLATSFRCDLPIAADAKLALSELLPALVDNRKTGKGVARAKLVRAKVEAILWPACRTHARLMRIVLEALQNAVVVGDQTEPVYAVNQFYEAPQTRSYFNSSTGYGSLGYGLPAALGAKLAAPQRPCVCLIGDGGLQFSLPELASAVEAKIEVVVIVWNNRSYGEIKTFMTDRQIEPIGVDLFTPDFVALAKALGCEATRPSSATELQNELAASSFRKVPTVIEIRADEKLAKELSE